MSIHTISQQQCHGGMQGYYRHDSLETDGPMRFGVFVPPLRAGRRAPVLYCLAGLTCNEETFAIKAGAQRMAAELGIALVTPDTSPRDTGIDGATGDWEFGEGAGFYLDATEAAYAKRFRMYSYVTKELPYVLGSHFPLLDIDREGLCGHSMGGHGALVIALKNPRRYRSVSAFAPIVAPSLVPWGRKALRHYLGNDSKAWREWDAVSLLEMRRRFPGTLLVEQGQADQFLEVQLQYWRLDAAARAARQPLSLRVHAGYDHSYWFIQSFIDEHLRHHAQALCD
ncbi:MAG: S-formylglutathione hydrolase [Dokdonella sp.]|uniref:S-formylglutathione hydrolase n=2 Tax=Dokdonella sp. TaxID=2291710 RepID=UPI0025B8056D|nr:S-formylglutathione hydrolase [Dokdonella sp.]MBX3700988.1 S-formylglutathione hydrolase [Dokdonella sp.]